MKLVAFIRLYSLYLLLCFTSILFYSLFYRQTFKKKRGNKPILGVTCAGRLGNRISCYAMVWALAKSYQFQAAMPERDLTKISRIFKNIKNDVEVVDADLYKQQTWRNYSVDQFILEQEACDKGPLYYHLKRQLGGGDCMNVQDIKFNVFIPKLNIKIYAIERHRKALRKMLKFSEYLQEQVDQILEEVKRNSFEDDDGVVFVGVHVRRADYLKYRREKYGDDLLDSSFYSQAMEWYKIHYGEKCIFVVASDDMEWCAANIPSSSQVHLVGGKSSELDLALLSSCNHSIVDYGTFSFWAAYLAGGEAIVSGEHRGPTRTAAGWLGWYRGVPTTTTTTTSTTSEPLQSDNQE